jgi:D-tyrosyl-tRNA(Tyr) deacylase
VRIDGEVTGRSGRGCWCFSAWSRTTTRSTGEALLERVLAYRVFADDEGRMNRSLRDTGGGLLLISQFTLAADTTRGLRPDFPRPWRRLRPSRCLRAVRPCLQRARSVAGGRFGADMQVSLVNDGRSLSC